MKKNHPVGRLILPLLATTLLASCIIPGYSPNERYSSNGNGYGIYRSLPSSFVGNSYYYDGNYYTGGDYQVGTYNHQGRHYSGRYNYRGTYLYGGSYQNQEPYQWTAPRHDAYRRENYRR